ncbi:hypothetical protein NQ314_020650 [Rhamnusium bicolor]|uniref:Uncharacterized protein n=1 Tax=Rhamnusium bicolor TaxID=1586634 RepID=A0AAV8WJM1_9CUCU|nr:hypothetical protein NQ314_020650 [Rhamnusium bicolor]
MNYLLNIKGEIRNSVHKIDDCLATSPITMIIRKGFPLSTLFDEVVHRIIGAGFIFKWENDFIKRRPVGNSPNTDFDSSSIKFKHLVQIFQMLLIGNCISGVVFICEIVLYKTNEIKMNKSHSSLLEKHILKDEVKRKSRFKDIAGMILYKNSEK